MTKDERFEACLAYYKANQPPAHILEQYKESLDDWAIKVPLYCAESETMSGLHQLFATTAIAFDLSMNTMDGFSERFCIPDEVTAFEELIRWHQRGFNDQRPQYWVAVRKIGSKKQFKESYERFYREGYGSELLPYAKTEDGSLFHSAIISRRESIQEDLGYDRDMINHLASYLLFIGDVN